MIRARLAGSTLATLALASALLGAQTSPTELPPIEDPPELSSMESQKLSRAVKKLRNSNATKRAEEQVDVVAFGRGAIPALIDATTTDHEGMQAGIQACLVELVDARDRQLVEDMLDSERVVLRRFAAQAVGKLGIPSQLELLTATLADEDDDVATLAALALAQNGREDGLARLVDTWLLADAAAASDQGGSRSRSRKPTGPDPSQRWKQPILEALAGLRDHGSHAGLVSRLAIDPEAEKQDPAGAAAVRLAAVELLHQLGDEASVRGLARALEDHHNLVQQAAIDAVRDLVEDKPPFQGATFQQIKELERLRALVRSWPGFEDDGEGGGRR